MGRGSVDVCATNAKWSSVRGLLAVYVLFLWMNQCVVGVSVLSRLVFVFLFVLADLTMLRTRIPTRGVYEVVCSCLGVGRATGGGTMGTAREERHGRVNPSSIIFCFF